MSRKSTLILCSPLWAQLAAMDETRWCVEMIDPDIYAWYRGRKVIVWRRLKGSRATLRRGENARALGGPPVRP